MINRHPIFLLYSKNWLCDVMIEVFLTG
jgi:F0F1-type ATP synthase membrane subunit b/b'